MSWSPHSVWYIGRGRLVICTVLASVVLLFVNSTVHPATSSAWSNWDSSSTVGEGADSLSFRERLARARPSDHRSASRSQTLSVFDDIFVISLSRRADRRERMNTLERALGLTFSYVDAVEADSAAVSQIDEQLRAVRAKYAIADFMWPPNNLSMEESGDLPFHRTAAELWTGPSAPDASPASDTRPPLVVAKSDFDITSLGDKEHGFFMTAPRIATWHSHMTLVRRIADQPNPNYTALILEDDVDIDWNIEARMRRAWAALPSDWDMVYLGHCPPSGKVFDARYGEAHNKPLQGAPELRPSFAPMCTHAYALSRDGARRLLTQLRYELFAYSRPIDQGYQHLICYKRVKSFTFLPAVVVQVRDGMSDIWGFDMSNMDTRDDLVDSTRERIALLEKLDNNAELA